MTDYGRAERLAINLTSVPYIDRSTELILAYADEIRRECADRAKMSATIMLSKLLTTLEHVAIPTALDAMEAEIMNKEAGK